MTILSARALGGDLSAFNFHGTDTDEMANIPKTTGPSYPVASFPGLNPEVYDAFTLRDENCRLLVRQLSRNSVITLSGVERRNSEILRAATRDIFDRWFIRKNQ